MKMSEKNLRVSKSDVDLQCLDELMMVLQRTLVHQLFARVIHLARLSNLHFRRNAGSFFNPKIRSNG